MTLYAAYRAALLADGTVTAFSTDIRPHTGVQQPPTNYIIMRDLGGPDISATVMGAGNLCRDRMELSFWGANTDLTVQIANHVRSSLASFNGLLGGGSGVKLAVGSISLPRSVYNERTQQYGYQIDVIATVDASTIS